MSGTGKPERAEQRPHQRPHQRPSERGDERRGFTPWPNQDENGVDLTLIRANLKLSLEERIRQGDRWRRQILRMHERVKFKRDPDV